MSYDDDYEDSVEPVGIPHVPGEGTSKDAAKSMVGIAAKLELRVARFLHARGEEGATDNEIEIGMGLIHQTASARRRTLVLAGIAVGGNVRRKTSSGRSACVWYVDGEWPGDGAVLLAVKAALDEQTQRRAQPEKGKGKPLDLWGMARRARAASGVENHADFHEVSPDRFSIFHRAISAKVAQLKPSEEALGRALAGIVYTAMSLSHEAGIDLPAHFNTLHRKLMGRAHQKRKENE